MNDLTVGLIDGWDARPFSEGLAEVRSLCASSFTGIVRVDEDAAEGGTNPDKSTAPNAQTDATGDDTTNDNPTVPENDTAVSEAANGTERGDASEETSPRRPWLAILDGAVRGVFDGEIDDFRGTTGTIYAAPAGAPVLLCGMVERVGEKRGDPHTEAHLPAVETDLPADFAGYVELIGNGLDGAYYVVYDKGRSSPVAVREEGGERVASTDPDGFDRASEHTSVYEVRDVSLDTVTVPEPEPGPDGSADADGVPASGSGRAESDPEGGLVAELRAERDRLRADVDRLESALDAYRSGASRGLTVNVDGGIDTDGRSAGHGERPARDAALESETECSPDEALAGTTLLVRYDSQGAPTLARAGEDTGPEAVRANLRITPHTDFDADRTRVSGIDFEAFLRSSIEYRFVEWVLCDLCFEIRETGNETALSALYEAIPAIDRADLKSTIDVEYVAEGETTRGTETFDVVFRDRMEEPLLVARLDETRARAPVERVTDLLTAANRVGETVDDLAGAMGVSGGYFEPEALRTAEEVTNGGFLSRDSKKSFVKRSRRRGYHLCLVEVVGDGFHTSVPEL